MFMCVWTKAHVGGARGEVIDYLTQLTLVIWICQFSSMINMKYERNIQKYERHSREIC